jgi:glycosyltransferase involved in cell wall biosynthesis
MASGKAIISSDVGGLTNLIIHGYNGLLIRPNKQELMEALVTLINNTNLREVYGNNSLAVVEAFSKKRWKEKWINQLENLIK